MSGKKWENLRDFFTATHPYTGEVVTPNLDHIPYPGKGDVVTTGGDEAVYWVGAEWTNHVGGRLAIGFKEWVSLCKRGRITRQPRGEQRGGPLTYTAYTYRVD